MEYKKVKFGDQEIDFAVSISEDEIERNASIEDMEDTIDLTEQLREQDN